MGRKQSNSTKKGGLCATERLLNLNKMNFYGMETVVMKIRYVSPGHSGDSMELDNHIDL